MGRRACLALACALSLTVASAARAEGSDAHATAVALFQEGVKLVEQQDCAAAIPKFRDSLKSEEGVGAHLNLADCYERTGAPDQAWAEYKAAERFATLKKNDERREVAFKGAYALERKLLRLTLDVPFVEGLAVTVNGAAVDKDLLATRQIALKPGPYAIVASAPGKLPVRLEGSGAAGEVKSVAIAFQEDPAARPPPAPPPQKEAPPSTLQRDAGLVVGIVGLTAVAAGSVFGILAMNDRSSLKGRFESAPGCQGTYPSGSCSSSERANLSDLESRAFTESTLSTVFMIVGGVALATGATLYFTSPSRRAKKTGIVVTPVGLGGTF